MNLRREMACALLALSLTGTVLAETVVSKPQSDREEIKSKIEKCKNLSCVNTVIVSAINEGVNSLTISSILKELGAATSTINTLISAATAQRNSEPVNIVVAGNTVTFKDGKIRVNGIVVDSLDDLNAGQTSKSSPN